MDYVPKSANDFLVKSGNHLATEKESGLSSERFRPADTPCRPQKISGSPENQQDR
jgi:hypothetical protein